MATRGTIALEYTDGTVKSVYVHFDSYLDGVGSTLLEHYADPAKVDQLMQHGAMSSLGAEIGEKQDFDSHSSWSNTCLFYGRDRGEDNVEANAFDDYDDYLNNNDEQEYNYIMRNDGVWYVNNGNSFMLLSEAIEQDSY